MRHLAACATKLLPLLLLLTLPAVVQAQWNYTVYNGKVTITKYTGSGGAVNIPSTINGLPVAVIGDDAFQDCSSLTSVTIPNSVISIGQGAFDYCTSLTAAYFQGNAPSLGGSSVFAGDSNATVYYLPGTTGWSSTFGGRPTVLWAGFLEVSISPPGAVSAGAQWQVDGGAWQASGSVVSSLVVGGHTVAFANVPGWTPPTSQAVTVSFNQTTIATGSYIQQFGNLQVVLSPAGAVSEGAQWQVDGGAWQNSGATVSDLTVGSHTLAFLSVSGWGAPVSQTVAVNFNQTTTTTAAYLAPRPVTATAIMINGFVVTVTITDAGIGYTNTPLVYLVGGGGSGAQAVAVVSNGVVTAINVLDAGFGYTNAPVIVIEAPFIFNPVLSIAPMSFLAFSNLTLGDVYQLQQSVAWYWSNQPVSFTATNTLYTQMVAGVAGNGDYRLALSPVPAQAFAIAQVNYGFLVSATMTSGGSGYVASPAVTIVGGGGTNATAVAQISGGVVTNITITDAGIGYTNTPMIRVAPPPAAAVAPTVLPVMRVDSASLAPYHNYQIQFKPDIGGTWGSWNGGLFSPTDVTNSQYLFITNSAGFFRLQYVP